jgi:hypothetical protein
MQPLSLARARALAADPARQQLFELIVAASTRDQILRARELQRSWVIANPDDFGMLDAGERLAYVEEALADDLATAPPTQR